MNIKLALASLVSTICVGMAQATLINRGGGLIYDDVMNVTWLQNTAGMTSVRPTFGGAENLARDFVYFDPVRNTTWNDWRLPMRDEFISLWNEGIRGGDDVRSNPFVNLISGSYWGWGWYQDIPNTFAYSGNWDFANGVWAPINGSYNLYAMPVMAGDVGIMAPVSEISLPNTLWLFGLSTCLLTVCIKIRVRRNPD